MTERTKTIKGLISGQVDMGTFGLVELELLAIENEMEALRKHDVIKSVCSHEYITDANWKHLTCRKCNDRIEPKQTVL